MHVPQGRSPLARQIEKLLYESSSSESSPRLNRTVSPTSLAQSKSSLKHPSASLSASIKSKKSKPNQTLRSQQSPVRGAKSPDTSRTRSTGGKSILKTSSHFHDELAKPMTCQQEKYMLRIKIGSLEKQLTHHSKKVNKLFDRVVEKREEVRNLTDQLFESKKKDLVVLELKETIKALEQSETSLIEEVNEQQQISNTTLQKLQNLQEEWSLEVDRIRRKYQDDVRRQLIEQQDQYEDKLRQVEEANWKLTNRIREMESIEEIEKSREAIKLSNENATLRNKLNERELDIERLREEVRGLKQARVLSEQDSAYEIKNLKSSLEGLNERNKYLKLNEREISIQETHEKQQLRKKVEVIQEEVARKNRVIREKDIEYKNHLEAITRKVTSLQDELKKVAQYERKVDELEKTVAIKDNELELTKNYYKEELENKKTLQDRQRKDWADTYGEMLNEIRNLKVELENHKAGFTSTRRSKDRNNYY